MNALAPIAKPDQLYGHMHAAVGKCYSIDDCAHIAVQADAIAAYFKQIKDDDTVKKFLAVKVRAWRRIGEVLLTVDASDCETVSAHIRKIRKQFLDDPAIKEMSDSAIGNALRLGKLPPDFFEDAVGQHPNIQGILATYQQILRDEWKATPEGRAEIAQAVERAKENQTRQAEWTAAATAKQAAEAAKVREEKAKVAAALDQQYLDHEAMEAARKEVGFTMDRRDREHMKAVMFLIKESVHETLRQAAFDHRVTMQYVLRAGLAMWLLGHSYPVDPDDMGLETKRKKAA